MGIEDDTLIRISEHSETEPLSLTQADREMLDRVVNADGTTRLGVRYDEDGYASLTSSTYVGVISFPDGPTLEVHPKAAGENLLKLLEYATRVDVDVFEEETALEEGYSVLDAFAVLFLREFDSLVTKGVQRSYVRTPGSESHLRGRLQMHRQMQRHPIAPTSFECEYDEYTYDTLLNRTIVRAARLLSRVVSLEYAGAVRERARRLEQRVEHVPVTVEEIDTIELTRLTDHYRDLLRLARLIIAHSFVENVTAGTQPTYAMMFDMAVLFEAAVERAAQAVVSEHRGWTIEPQESTTSLLRGRPHVTIRPDFILRINGQPALVGDAKWKTYRSNSDIYQVMAYQSAYDVSGVLVYPSQSGDLETHYEVKNGRKLSLIELPTGRYASSTSELGEVLETELAGQIMQLL
jgi:5-methylcytosine-specific restriction enzyme subunit McrC